MSNTKNFSVFDFLKAWKSGCQNSDYQHPIFPSAPGTAAQNPYHPCIGSLDDNRYRRCLPVNRGINIVPEMHAYVVERFGQYSKTLDPGIHILIPFVDRIAYVHSLREKTIEISSVTSVTKDNIPASVTGVVRTQVVDPYRASYGNDDPIDAVTQVAESTMSEILGKIGSDKTKEELEGLYQSAVDDINKTASLWGLKCFGFEIKGVSPPEILRLQVDMAKKKQAEQEIEATKERMVQLPKPE
ncbi:hypothetical protein SLEP1_g10446 [Rubroshorea leprosula]|uniref:Band 7 domain-containing protein n=1 Tax=Rubroshorea leprosula TaxID=152421 RepID=A0AAV5I844_9ROSI|nr:hypothetical protein SLEP1_g10446 [Rubroshorea leprosula]